MGIYDTFRNKQTGLEIQIKAGPVHLSENEDVPVVGMGCTLYGWSDSWACTVVAVSRSGTQIVLRKDKATLLNEDAVAKGSKQEWKTEPNVFGEEVHVTRRKTSDGFVWKQVGTKLGQVAGTVSLGDRLPHHDFNFMRR